MQQQAAPVVNYAISDVGKRIMGFRMSEDQMDAVYDWFNEYQRDPRTYPWCFEGVPQNTQVTTKAAWEFLTSEEDEDVDQDQGKHALFARLEDTQDLIELSRHNQELWDMTGFTSRGLIGFYGAGFTHTFKQGGHIMMDRTYVCLKGEVRRSVQFRKCDVINRKCDMYNRICDLLYLTRIRICRGYDWRGPQGAKI